MLQSTTYSALLSPTSSSLSQGMASIVVPARVASRIPSTTLPTPSMMTTMISPKSTMLLTKSSTTLPILQPRFPTKPLVLPPSIPHPSRPHLHPPVSRPNTPLLPLPLPPQPQPPLLRLPILAPPSSPAPSILHPLPPMLAHLSFRLHPMPSDPLRLSLLIASVSSPISTVLPSFPSRISTS